jgi:glutamate--cysteine ligase catalytic subunit
VEYQRKHSAPAMVSPLHAYPGPPHSYSNHQSTPASALPGPHGGLLSPPESRRTSGDEKEQRQQTRQSLPSIHEALGAEQPLSYPPQPSAPVSGPPSFPPPSTAPSPSEQRTRTFSVDHINNQGPPNPFSHPRSPFMSTTTSLAPPPPPPQAPSDHLQRSSFSSTHHNPKLPTLHPLRTTQSPTIAPSRPQYSSYQQQPGSTYEASAPSSAGSMNPQYGYSQQYSSTPHPLSAPPLPPAAPNSGYPQSAAIQSAPPMRYPPPSWRSDNSDLARLEEKKLGRPTNLAPYGESVKRHLESFDLEASLNEVPQSRVLYHCVDC